MSESQWEARVLEFNSPLWPLCLALGDLAWGGAEIQVIPVTLLSIGLCALVLW